ncbi:MAG: phospholipase D family protein, partial [Bradyrhizobium sp.]
MLEFLHDTSILTSAKKLIEEGERIDLAVAYWGKGAKDRLNVTTAKRTRIICDLLSGSCNPDEIRGLVDVSSESGIQVRHLDRLHAKIYWTPTAVIVGSANASANGLGDESRLGAIEAALMTDNASALKSVEEWFQSKWEQARPINEHLLEEGRKAWDGGTIGYPVDTVLDVYVRDPERFRRRVWLTYFWSEGSHAAEKRFNEIKQQFYSPRQLARINDENLPVYDLDTSDVSSVRIGDVVVDVWDRLYEVLE